MISWIQNHLIRHGRWIFLTLLALIIVAFVFTIGNTPGCTTDRSAYEQREFYGYDLNSQRDMTEVSEKVSLSAYLNGQQIRSDQQFQSQATSRIAQLHLADHIGIPAPDQETLREYITSKRAFQGPDGQFSPDAYTRFLDSFESNPRAPQDRLVTVLEEDYRIEQLTERLAGPGYLLPAEAKVQTQRSQTTFDLATAVMDYAAFTPEIDPTQEALEAYYEANTARYEIPERIEASYVFFPSESYSDAIPASEESDLRAHFTANRARFVAEYEASQAETDSADDPENPQDSDDTPAVTFEDVRDRVAADLAEQTAERATNQAAQNFAVALYNNNIKRDSAAFDALLDEFEATLKPIEPYTAEEVNRRDLSAEMLESAFTLGGNRYFSDAYSVEGGYAVLIYKGRIDPTVPPFEEIAGVVEADYRTEQKRRLFNERGEALRADLQDRIADGTDFMDAAEALGLETRDLDPFKAAEAPRDLNPSVLQQAQGMQTGEISPMLTSRGTGTFVYVQNKDIPEISEDNEDYSQAKEFLRYINQSVSSGALVNELIARGLPESARQPE